MDTKEKDHPLSLKVMRLTRPSLFTGISISSEPHDIAGHILKEENRNDMAIPEPNTGVGQVLLLPQGFGNIYLGETFSCSLCVHNGCPDAIENVTMKAVLQMSSQRVPLLSAEEESMSQLSSDGMFNRIIHHEVKELGTHILVCEVQYQGVTGSEMNFRKFFKFQVMKPLDVKTKFYNAEDSLSEEVYLEAGIENTTSGPIFLEHVTLEPAPCYTVTPLNSVVGGGEDESVFGHVGVVNPHDTRQHLFCLRPTPEAQLNPVALRHSLVIGKLDIVWRTSMGDKGRLQTSKLQRIMLTSSINTIKYTIDVLPSEVYLEETFNISVTLSNISEEDMCLRLEFLSGLQTVEWHSNTTKILDKLPAGSCEQFKLTLMPLKLGLQTVPAVKITELNQHHETTYDNLAQIFVRRPDLAT